MTTDFFFPPEMWKSKKKKIFHETAVPSTDTHYPLHYEFTELQQQGQSTAGLKDNLHSWEGHEHKLWLHSVYHSFGRGPQTQIQTRLQKVTCSNQCQCCYMGTGSFTPLPIAILWNTFHFRAQFFNSTFCATSSPSVDGSWGSTFTDGAVRLASTSFCQLLYPYPHEILPSRFQTLISQIKAKLLPLAIFNSS